MQRVLRRDAFRVSMDTDFAGVIERCATAPRRGQLGTWITKDMRSAYTTLHTLGFAHSCEVYLEGALVGGVYGVALGRVFFGESMFSRVSNASKVALIRLCRFLVSRDYHFFDAQLHTAHVERLGGHEIARREFLRRLDRALTHPTMRGSWTELFAAV